MKLELAERVGFLWGDVPLPGNIASQAGELGELTAALPRPVSSPSGVHMATPRRSDDLERSIGLKAALGVDFADIKFLSVKFCGDPNHRRPSQPNFCGGPGPWDRLTSFLLFHCRLFDAMGVAMDNDAGMMSRRTRRFVLQNAGP